MQEQKMVMAVPFQPAKQCRFLPLCVFMGGVFILSTPLF